jgi:hypothetical protein
LKQWQGRTPRNYRATVVWIAERLNSDKRSVIGDPRTGVYKVSFEPIIVRELQEYVTPLVELAVIPRATIEYNEFASPTIARVTIWSRADRKRLFEHVKEQLHPDRKKQFEDLVVAFEPIPDDLLEKIVAQHRDKHRSLKWIADALNKRDVMTGRGGKSWTVKKVRDSVAEYERRRAQLTEAA